MLKNTVELLSVMGSVMLGISGQAMISSSSADVQAEKVKDHKSCTKQ